MPYLNSNTKADWQRWAEQMNIEAGLAKRRGLRYGYHNHAHEFTIDLGGGATPWDVLTERARPQVVHLEVDLYWAYTGGVNTGAADPLQFAIDVINSRRRRSASTTSRTATAPTPPRSTTSSPATWPTSVSA